MSQTQMSRALRDLGECQTALAGALPAVPWLATLLLALALGLSGMALHKLKQVAANTRAVMVEKPLIYELVKEPLTEAEQTATLAWFQRLHPEVRFEVSKDGGLQVSILDGAHHADWLYALSALQSRDHDVIWDPVEFCVGRCPSNTAAMAVVKSYRQKMTKRD